ncbi:MAG: hypothetical protein AABZ60_11630 [Planctomycetota bacterium]
MNQQSSQGVLLIGFLGILLLTGLFTNQFVKHPVITQLQQVKSALKEKYPFLKSVFLVFRQETPEAPQAGLILTYEHQQPNEKSIDYEMDQLVIFIWKELNQPPQKDLLSPPKKKKQKDLKSRINYFLVKNQTKEKKYSLEELTKMLPSLPTIPQQFNLPSHIQSSHQTTVIK